MGGKRHNKRSRLGRAWDSLRGKDAAATDDARTAAIAKLPPEEAERARRLEEKRRKILMTVQERQNFSAELLALEVGKLDEIVDAFVELAGTCARWHAHLAAVDWDDLESELRRAETKAERAVDEHQRTQAVKDAALYGKRREVLAKMQAQLADGKTELGRIETGFSVVESEISLMRDTKELGGKLDDILVGVGAVREMTQATEKQRS